MKFISIGVLLLLAASNLSLLAQSSRKAWVRETDLSTGQMYDIPLQPNGGPFVPTLDVSETGNSFELYAVGTAWDAKVYHLDTKLIRAYSPVAAFSLETGDPYIRGDESSGRFVKRIRADQQIRMRVNVQGLVANSENPAERSVYLAIHGTNYDRKTYSSLEAREDFISDRVLYNGTYPYPPFYHALTTTPVSKACGEMKFTVVRYAADGVPDTIIAQPKIEIWPVATATFGNITEKQVFIDKIPPVVFNYRDLYPDSRTYVQIYPGPAELGKVGTVLETTERKIGKFYNPDINEEPATVPQTLSVGVEELSNYTPIDGIYTVEIITHTPFYNRNPERLAVLTFEVDHIISTRGRLSTAK